MHNNMHTIRQREGSIGLESSTSIIEAHPHPHPILMIEDSAMNGHSSKTIAATRLLQDPPEDP